MSRPIIFIASLLALCAPLCADSKAKIDVGPAFVHLDLLESGKTIDTMDLPGVRADAAYTFENGITIKPSILYGKNNGSLFSTSLSLGQYLPLNDEWSFLPNFGVTYSYVHTSIDIPFISSDSLREHFRSISPFLGLEAYYTFSPSWRLCGSFQYAWSRTHTEIENLPNSKSDCKGPIYSLLLEKDITPAWSLNIGMGYNISLTKEKHGLRGTGVKLGLARWY